VAAFRYVVCDVFTAEPLAGNQVAVFTDAREIPEHQLQRLAREMNFSETTFVYPPESDGHVRMRIFTPGTEVPFAGHPTLGTCHAWLETLPATGATLEAKGAGTGARRAQVISASGIASRLSICSFEPTELRAAAGGAPGIARILIVDRDAPAADFVALARDAQATGVNVPWQWLDAGMVARLQAAGLLVAGGTIELDALSQCLALGIDAIDSNDPGPIVTALRSRAVRA